MNTTNSCGNSQSNPRKFQFLLLIPLENQTLSTVCFSCFFRSIYIYFQPQKPFCDFQDLKLSTKNPRCKLFCKIQYVFNGTSRVLKKSATDIFNSRFPRLRPYCTYQVSRKNTWISQILGRVLARNLKNKGLHFVVILRTYLLYLSNVSLYLLP